MFWESKDNTCINIKIAGKKIVEICNGWYIDKVFYPKDKCGEDMNSLIIEIRRDNKRA